MMVDLSPKDISIIGRSTKSSISLETSTPENSLKINATINLSTPQPNIASENNTLMMGCLISGALFVVVIIILIKLYLDGRCIRLRASGLLPSSSKGYRYNGRYSLY